MLLFSYLKNKKYLFIISLALIISILSLILLTDRFQTNQNSSSNSALKGIDKIKAEAKSLGDDTMINNSGSSGSYRKILYQINILENNKVSKGDKYKAIGAINENVIGLYSSTNNHKLYDFQISLKDFLKTNYPNESENIQPPSCFDPKCAQNPQPEEILKVIQEIKDSNLPDYIKENDIQMITNFGYLNDDKLESKVGDYLIVADHIKYSQHYINAGINERISSEIENYVKATYPKEYENFVKDLTVTPTVDNK